MTPRMKMLYDAAVSALIAAALNHLNRQGMVSTLRDAMNAHNATKTEIDAIAPALAKFMDSFATKPELAKDYVLPNRRNSAVLHVTYIVSEDSDDWNVTRLPDPDPAIQPPGWYSSMSVYAPGAANSVMVHLYWQGGNPGDAERANVEAQIMELVRLEPDIKSAVVQ